MQAQKKGLWCSKCSKVVPMFVIERGEFTEKKVSYVKLFCHCSLCGGQDERNMQEVHYRRINSMAA